MRSQRTLSSGWAGVTSRKPRASSRGRKGPVAGRRSFSSVSRAGLCFMAVGPRCVMMKVFPNGLSLIPQRYIIASLFIAAMLLLFAVVQAGRPVSAGGVASVEAPAVMNLGGYEILAELRLEDGWEPRFDGTLDPDQLDPWPFEGGFGTPW